VQESLLSPKVSLESNEADHLNKLAATAVEREKHATQGWNESNMVTMFARPLGVSQSRLANKQGE
jgi:hypothetical protein